MDIPSKDDVLRDAEETRSKADAAIQNAKEIWSGQNSVATGWRAAKWAGREAKERVIAKTLQADNRIRSNIYGSLGIAFGIGLVAGLLMDRSRRKT
ncbi:MAG: hypothetical protein ABJC04_09310 [Verrucomicrobiota bacterium]